MRGWSGAGLVRSEGLQSVVAPGGCITTGFECMVAGLRVTKSTYPKSTLKMRVSAIADDEHIMGLYRHVTAQRYRLFSYEDALELERRQ